MASGETVTSLRTQVEELRDEMKRRTQPVDPVYLAGRLQAILSDTREEEDQANELRRRRSQQAQTAKRLDDLRHAARAVVREWDDRGDNGCSVAIQNELRAALSPQPTKED